MEDTRRIIDNHVSFLDKLLTVYCGLSLKKFYMAFEMKAFCCAVFPSSYPLRQRYIQHCNEKVELLVSNSFSLFLKRCVYRSKNSQDGTYAKT